MASYQFSLENGQALIMPAGGSTPCGNNFTAGRDDVVFKIVGDYTMSIDANGNVTICLSNNMGWIFANKNNYSAWFYYDTVWARNHNNCAHVWLDIALSRQAHGGWYDGNTAWKYGAGWKGGTGIRGYDQWIKYRGGNIEADCAGEYTGVGCCGAGSYIGAAKRLNNMCFNLGQVDFTTQKGFWIGANLDIYAGGWEQWQFIPWPVIVFDAPSLSIETDELDICGKYATSEVHMCSDSQFGQAGGTWELQVATKSDFSDAVRYTEVNNDRCVTFSNIKGEAGVKYYVRGRLKASDIRYSNWISTEYEITGEIPAADAVVADITEMECYELSHGGLVTGGIL